MSAKVFGRVVGLIALVGAVMTLLILILANSGGNHFVSMFKEGDYLKIACFFAGLFLLIIIPAVAGIIVSMKEKVYTSEWEEEIIERELIAQAIRNQNEFYVVQDGNTFAYSTVGEDGIRSWRTKRSQTTPKYFPVGQRRMAKLQTIELTRNYCYKAWFVKWPEKEYEKKVSYILEVPQGTIKQAYEFISE